MANKTESMIRDAIRDELRRDDRAKGGSIDDRSTLKSAHENTVNSMLVLMALASLVGIGAALSFDRSPDSPAVQSQFVQPTRDLPRDPGMAPPQSQPQALNFNSPAPEAPFAPAPAAQ